MAKRSVLLKADRTHKVIWSFGWSTDNEETRNLTDELLLMTTTDPTTHRLDTAAHHDEQIQQNRC